jgi:hypothetical protein
LSTFERVLLRAHLADCPSCEEFRNAIGGLTGALREAPLEEFGGVIEIGRLRRRPRLRLAPAVAAMAVAAVGLGSILATTAVRSGSVGRQARTPVVTAELAALDTMNLRTSRGLARVSVLQQIRATNEQSSVRGGPVIGDR